MSPLPARPRLRPARTVRPSTPYDTTPPMRAAVIILAEPFQSLSKSWSISFTPAITRNVYTATVCGAISSTEISMIPPTLVC
jgi:hypothetical protein